LAGSAVGFLATTMGRLYASTSWALRDTRTPLKFAVIRVLLATALGWLLAFPTPVWLGIDPRFGLAGLTISAGFAAWVEFSLLRSAINRRIGKTGLSPAHLIKLWAIALISGGLAFTVKWAISSFPPLPLGLIVISIYGTSYFGFSLWIGLPEAKSALKICARLLFH